MDRATHTPLSAAVRSLAREAEARHQQLQRLRGQAHLSSPARLSRRPGAASAKEVWSSAAAWVHGTPSTLHESAEQHSPRASEGPIASTSSNCRQAHPGSPVSTTTARRASCSVSGSVSCSVSGSLPKAQPSSTRAVTDSPRQRGERIRSGRSSHASSPTPRTAASSPMGAARERRLQRRAEVDAAVARTFSRGGIVAALFRGELVGAEEELSEARAALFAGAADRRALQRQVDHLSVRLSSALGGGTGTGTGGSGGTGALGRRNKRRLSPGGESSSLGGSPARTGLTSPGGSATKARSEARAAAAAAASGSVCAGQFAAVGARAAGERARRPQDTELARLRAQVCGLQQQARFTRRQQCDATELSASLEARLLGKETRELEAELAAAQETGAMHARELSRSRADLAELRKQVDAQASQVDAQASASAAALEMARAEHARELARVRASAHAAKQMIQTKATAELEAVRSRLVESEAAAAAAAAAVVRKQSRRSLSEWRTPLVECSAARQNDATQPLGAHRKRLQPQARPLPVVSVQREESEDSFSQEVEERLSQLEESAIEKSALEERLRVTEAELSRCLTSLLEARRDGARARGREAHLELRLTETLRMTGALTTESGALTTEPQAVYVDDAIAAERARADGAERSRAAAESSRDEAERARDVAQAELRRLQSREGGHSRSTGALARGETHLAGGQTPLGFTSETPLGFTGGETPLYIGRAERVEQVHTKLLPSEDRRVSGRRLLSAFTERESFEANSPTRVSDRVLSAVSGRVLSAVSDRVMSAWNAEGAPSELASPKRQGQGALRKWASPNPELDALPSARRLEEYGKGHRALQLQLFNLKYGQVVI